jgi:hypothetical protein
MSHTAADELEQQTRKRRIDPKLQARGWSVAPVAKPRAPSPEAITECETANGPADYALSVGGQVLGVIEAIRLSRGPGIKLTQAERYSRGITDSPFDFDGFRAPYRVHRVVPTVDATAWRPSQVDLRPLRPGHRSRTVPHSQVRADHFARLHPQSSEHEYGSI